MIDQRKMIDALLFLEKIFWRLGSLTETFMQIIGRRLSQLVFGHRGRRLLSHREIYAANLFKYWKNHGRSRASRGLYIGRVGRHYSHRSLRVGQD